MPRPKQRTPELRDQVLARAVELLAAEGVAGFTTRAVARAAGTSTPAVYELFGDRAGLLREVFFTGFRLLAERLGALTETVDPRADLIELVAAYRGFMRENPTLTQVMLARPFSDFDPAPEEAAAGAAVRTFIVGRVRRCVAAGLLDGDETDVAHVLIALVQGLAAAENARRLGTTGTSVDRRWDMGVRALLAGLSPRQALARPDPGIR